MSEQSTPVPDEEEVTILVGGMTREEFLGQPEQITFVQPKRSISKRYRERRAAASKPPVEDEG